MKYLFLSFVVFCLQARGQVCCSPIGNGQAGGGSLLQNVSAQWPNALLVDRAWHWAQDVQFAFQGPSGNISYGPQLLLRGEISKAWKSRTVGFVAGNLSAGSIHEQVTFFQTKTNWYAGKISGGIRRVLGNSGRLWMQYKLILPLDTHYSQSSFPFRIYEPVRGEFLVLYNQTMPWSIRHPDLFSTLFVSALIQNNYTEELPPVNDKLGILHLSGAIHSFHPIFLGMFMQYRTEKLLLPPSIWDDQNEGRQLSTSIIGLDLAVDKPGWDKLLIRIGIPFWSRSSSNGFPDGTQAAASLVFSISSSHVLSNE